MRPKLLSTLPGYTRAAFAGDLVAGLTVAMVAIPLSLAIAIASGAEPGTGLVTAIVGGVLISALGGSRVQIGGPTGAFIVVVSGIVAEHGYDGLAVATLMAGVLLIVMALARLGTAIKFIPYPVTVGFTGGIAVIISITQIPDLLGLDAGNPEGDPIHLGPSDTVVLHHVLERRKGLPILLCVVYMEVARRCGVPFDGVGFPGHFLVAPRESDTPFYVDPFNQGRVLTRDVLAQRLEAMTGQRPGADEVDAKYDLARALVNQGRLGEAAEMYAWLWEAIPTQAPTMVGVRASPP